MRRIFITGDKHGDFRGIESFIEFYDLDKSDWIIVLGDMGLFWKKDGKDAWSFVEYYENTYKVNLAFIDGNHENFDWLNRLPVDIDGRRIISDHISYFPRGYVFDLYGKRFLCMGGADSVDRFRRIKNISWWEQEKITEEDIAEVDKTIHYDYVLTHAAPQSIVDNNKWQLCMLLIAEDLIDHSSEQRLDELMNKLDFDHWFFGHYHNDIKLDNKFQCLYHGFVEIE